MIFATLFRSLLQRPGFTAIAVLTLALGIGANTAIFSVFNGVLLRSLPYREPDRLMLLWEANGSGKSNHVSSRNFVDWRAQQHSFETISAYSGRWAGPDTVIGGSEPARVYVVSVYRDFFTVLGVPPLSQTCHNLPKPLVARSVTKWHDPCGRSGCLLDSRTARNES